MSKTLIPQNDRVLIKPVDEGEQMYGNIVIPDMGKEKPEMGEVVATGPGRMSEFGKFIPVNAKVGEVVLVPKIGTLRFDYEGEEYYIIQDREILASIKEENNG
uniref:Co-chaperonin GroES n=1 Tax=uncultured virus TaxID=340016 RepID=A0A221S2Y9_9VIRU|nr:co-chaperonin GroES [uncultured virus]